MKKLLKETIRKGKANRSEKFSSCLPAKKSIKRKVKLKLLRPPSRNLPAKNLNLTLALLLFKNMWRSLFS